MKIIKEAKSSKYDGMFWSEFFNEYQEDGNKFPRKLISFTINVKVGGTGKFNSGFLKNVSATCSKYGVSIDAKEGNITWELVDARISTVEDNKIIVSLGERNSFLTLTF